MKRIVDRDKCAKYIAKNSFCTFERAKDYIDNGVETLTWLNIKPIKWGKFEIEYK